MTGVNQEGVVGMRPFEAAHHEIEAVAHQKCRVNREERTHAECNERREYRERNQGRTSVRETGTFFM